MLNGKESSSMLTSSLTSLLLWSFLPDALTNFLLTRYYAFRCAAKSPSIPKPGSLRHKRHYRNCYTIVIIAYFVYAMTQTLYTLHIEDGGSFYQKLGITRSRARDELRKRSRQLLLQHHPDKNPNGSMDTYIELKSIIDTLDDANFCNVYEKYGAKGIATAQQHGSNKTYANPEEQHRDLIFALMVDWVAHHASTFIMLAFMGIVRGGKQKESLVFWRFVGILFLGAFETFMYFVDFTTLDAIQEARSPRWTSLASLLSWTLINIPIFQRIRFLRALLLNLGLAASQCAHLWFPPRTRFADGKKAVLAELNDVYQAIEKDIHQEAKQALVSALGPFEDSEEMRTLLKRQMGQLVADSKEHASHRESAELEKKRK